MLCGVFFAPYSLTGAVAEDFGGYTIGEITIIRHSIFDLSKPEESGVIGRLGNKLHVLTQEKVIRQELLFKEGDPYDKSLIEESERNLRRYKFLTEIKITVTPDHDTKILNVLVNARDQWSLMVGGTFGGTSGNSEVGVDIGESNFLGSGQSVMYKLRRDNRGLSQSFGYRDDRWLDSRYVLDIAHKSLADEKVYGFLLAKPFFSLDTKRAHGLSYRIRDHDDSSLSSASQRLVGFYGFGSRFGDDDVIRTSLKLSYGEEYVNYGENGAAISADLNANLDANLDAASTGSNTNVNRDNKLLISTSLLFNPTNYDKATYIMRFREVEDIYLGTTLTMSVGARLEMLGASSSDVSAGIKVTRNYKVGERDYLFARVEARRNDDLFNRQFAVMSAQYYMRWFKYQTVFLRLQMLYSESEVNRFYLGGDNGLRGYEADEFQGKNRIILNLEDRIFTYKTMLYGLLEPGFVVFVDVGNTWNNFSGDKLEELRGGFGVGLRLALLKSPGVSLVTLDYGHSFDLSRSPVMTFGMEGAF